MGKEDDIMAAYAYCEKCDVRFKKKFAVYTEDDEPICPKCKEPVEEDKEEENEQLLGLMVSANG